MIASLIRYLYVTITGKHTEAETQCENTETAQENEVISAVSDDESVSKGNTTVVQNRELELAVPFVYVEPTIIDENKWQARECHATMSPREKCWRCGVIFKQ